MACIKYFAATAMICFISARSSIAASPSFSDRDKQIHNQYVYQISEKASTCLQDLWREHVIFFNRHRVSKFYGDRNVDLDTREKRIAALRLYQADASLIDELEPVSCIGITLDCLGEAFADTQDQEALVLWEKIHKFVQANGLSGVYLINALQALGWQVLYWNPDPSQNATWDAEDPTLIQGYPVDWESPVKDSQGRSIFHPSWGLHGARFATVVQKNKYYLTPVDDKKMLVDFHTKVPVAFRKVPFFVGVAHAGYHVFPGYLGRVIEAHSTRPLNSINNLEKSQFNPLDPVGGPRWSLREKYRSGVIAIPPAAQ